jgi:N6-adenosine-specific RNA methylase IME4
VSVFEGLTPPYSTIVADPPWLYKQGGPTTGFAPLRPPPYSMMTVDEIAALPVGDLAAESAHLYLWTTNAYLRASFDLAESWGFRHSQTLTWCKPRRGIGPGGAFSNTTEFVLFCRRGTLAPTSRVDTTWWTWPRGRHSVKPSAFLDLVEAVSPGPYVELFARAPRLGWDSWGKGYELRDEAS